ncbi:hypothetical protein C8Q70DRAFT_215498 [Cubamyces menziesii]|uniref:Uncharacterized protein n=1 Tax=Trametes cubensis TaxID=1111947 RepID=A0AAD7U0T5_9APHY|nr:hypothetical protein C8Q70DRAFT_215498 [Cubamyces menziesii]KAJ8489079.1 hypothetical protein ONZ51_g3169 [Trametes cubensis]
MTQSHALQVGKRLFYSPSPRSYAVIRLDPVGMVRPFNDAQALLEAQAMQPKPYLIYLRMERALPWPDQPWYRFEIEPIATTLRPEDEARGITSDMCIPIFPNTNHPAARESLQPSPEGLFPYDNCYHWFQAKLVDVRIKARPELFDETNAVSISVRTRIRTLLRLWEEDGDKMMKNRKRLQQAPTEVRLPSKCDGPEPQPLRASVSCDTAGQHLTQLEASEVSSETFSLCSARSSHSNHSLDNLAAMDIFSGPNDDVELVPLVDLWISELGDHLKQEDIPDPQEMYAEFEHIAQIVKEARIRSYAALTAPAQVPDDESGERLRKKHNLSGPAQSWGKLRAQAKRVSSRLEKVFCLPYLLIWP